VRRVAAVLAMSLAVGAFAQRAGDALAIPRFSSVTPGSALPGGWRVVTLPRIAPAQVAIDLADGAGVLRVHAEASAGTAAHAFAPPRDPHARLAWRWKVDRVLDRADLATRAGDDFAARVYVFFDVPAEELPWRDRVKLALARLLHGADVPSAGICYVWDNAHPAGTIAPNPYAPQVRTFVLRNRGDALAWHDESRDLQADFRAAFPERGRQVPRVTGLAAGNDTDQTGERATAWFGDFTWSVLP
jgi:hypothetical protein